MAIAIPTTPDTSPVATVILDWDDVRKRFRSLMDGSVVSPHSPENRSVGNWRTNAPFNPANPDSNWHGGNAEDMLRWLRLGFNPSSIIDTGAIRSSDRKRRKLRYNDHDGDFDYERMITGEPEFYRKWDVKKSRPGMKVIVDLDFVADVNASTIAQYGDWVAALLRSIQDLGYDLELAIAFHTLNLAHSGQRIDTVVNVKKAGQALDFKNWSPWFSPTGFRMLGFTALSMSVTKVGGVHAHNYGNGVPCPWDIEWDAKRRTLTVKCDPFSSNFPAEMMNARLVNLKISDL